MWYQPVFSEKLPEFVNKLPVVENCNYTVLRKIQVRWLYIWGEREKEDTYITSTENALPILSCFVQGLTWSRVLSEDIVKEIVETLPNTELKLNVLAMLSSSDFVRDLVMNNCLEVVFPYAEVSKI